MFKTLEKSHFSHFSFNSVSITFHQINLHTSKSCNFINTLLKAVRTPFCSIFPFG